MANSNIVSYSGNLAVWVLLAYLAFGLDSKVLPESLNHAGHGGPIKSLTASPDRNLLVSTSFDYSGLVWSTHDMLEVSRLIGHDAAVNIAAFSPNGKYLATGGDDSRILLWRLDDLAKNKDHPPILLRGHTAKVVDLVFSSDGSKLLSAGWDHVVRIWDVKTEKQVGLLRGHDGPVNAVELTKDDKYVFTAGYDGTIRYWELPERKFIRNILDNGWGVNVMDVNETADLLMYGTTNGLMRIDSLQKGELLVESYDEGVPISALKYYPETRKIFFGTMKGRVVIYDTQMMEVEKDFLAVHGPIWDLEYVPEKNSLIVAGLDDYLTEWLLGSFNTNYFLEKKSPRRFESDTDNNGALQFARKCSICHTLDTKDIGRRAGPPLNGVFGRKAGTVPGYPYSESLVHSQLIWNEVTIDKLFEAGPDVLTPGTKMPIQRIKTKKDRRDLIEFLKDATKAQ
ncbi:MAG: c-type cytochrome [Pseudomonadota bacterium]|nr:c-type cytochrome [Pseudomonadota bacterium]